MKSTEKLPPVNCTSKASSPPGAGPSLQRSAFPGSPATPNRTTHCSSRMNPQRPAPGLGPKNNQLPVLEPLSLRDDSPTPPNQSPMLAAHSPTQKTQTPPLCSPHSPSRPSPKSPHSPSPKLSLYGVGKNTKASPPSGHRMLPVSENGKCSASAPLPAMAHEAPARLSSGQQQQQKKAQPQAPGRARYQSFIGAGASKTRRPQPVRIDHPSLDEILKCHSCISLELESATIRPGEPVTVRWETNLEDPHHDLRSWDFLALHREGDDPGNYESSLYMLGVECGQLEFCAPKVEARYIISAVRDLRLLWRNLSAGPRKETLQAHIDVHGDEHLIALASVAFRVTRASRRSSRQSIPEHDCSPEESIAKESPPEDSLQKVWPVDQGMRE